MATDLATINRIVNDLRHLRGHALGCSAWAPVVAAEELLLELGKLVESRQDVRELPDAAGYWWGPDEDTNGPCWSLLNVYEKEGAFYWSMPGDDDGEDMFEELLCERGLWARCLPPDIPQEVRHDRK